MEKNNSILFDSWMWIDFSISFDSVATVSNLIEKSIHIHMRNPPPQNESNRNSFMDYVLIYLFLICNICDN